MYVLHWQSDDFEDCGSISGDSESVCRVYELLKIDPKFRFQLFHAARAFSEVQRRTETYAGDIPWY
jgi:hypothetical protein